MQSQPCGDTQDFQDGLMQVLHRANALNPRIVDWLLQSGVEVAASRPRSRSLPRASITDEFRRTMGRIATRCKSNEAGRSDGERRQAHHSPRGVRALFATARRSWACERCTRQFGSRPRMNLQFSRPIRRQAFAGRTGCGPGHDRDDVQETTRF